jgi:hypothetical protein
MKANGSQQDRWTLADGPCNGASSEENEKAPEHLDVSGGGANQVLTITELQ